MYLCIVKKAQMVELVDTLSSGGSAFTGMGVRVPLWVFLVKYALACLVHYQILAHPKGYVTQFCTVKYAGRLSVKMYLAYYQALAHHKGFQE